MVKKALSIYALHYVLTRHLCLTHASMAELQSTKLVPRNMPWVTPRLLNRQIKALLDEQLLKETTSLFETFAKSLKPKSRKEWAPCLVAFLVLCLFMEAVETAADTFVVSQNEVDLRSRSVPAYRRAFALAICKEIENLPFKQFAYQFHNIYQTHTRDASTKAFNPLLDANVAAQGELDSASRELVSSLRELLQGDSCKSGPEPGAGQAEMLIRTQTTSWISWWRIPSCRTRRATRFPGTYRSTIRAASWRASCSPSWTRSTSSTDNTRRGASPDHGGPGRARDTGQGKAAPHRRPPIYKTRE